MADALVSLEASDIFGLGGNFISKSAGRSIDLAHAVMKKANGDFEVFSSTFNSIDNVTATYTFNSLTGLGAALPALGEVSNAYLITGFDVSSPTGEYPTININGHQHEENAHTENNQYAVSAAMIALITGAVGAYDLAGLASDPTCVQSSTYTIGAKHIDAECGSPGNHWVGQTIEGMETITVNYIGHISASAVIDGWTVTNISIDDSNDAFDISSITAEKLIVRS